MPLRSVSSTPSLGSSQGIYLFGNDSVLGVLQALVERLNHNFSKQHCAPLPICIIPSSNDLRGVRRWVAHQELLNLFDNDESMQHWEAFAQSVWAAQPVVARLSQHYSDAYRQVQSSRRFCAFDGEFAQFIFCDAHGASTHGLDRLEEALIQLQTYEFVVNDWEHLKVKPAALLDLSYVGAALNWDEEQLRDRIHGASFFGSHAGLIGVAERETLLQQLVEKDEIRWINPLSWWNDGALLNYITLRSGEQGSARSLYNFARPSCTLAGVLDSLTSELGSGLKEDEHLGQRQLNGDFLCNFLPEHLWAQRQAIEPAETQDA